MRPKPVVLMTLSGVGVSAMLEANALKQASMPTWSKLIGMYPSSLLESAGSSVGLPSYASGSPEAGHRTIGLGRVWKTSEARVESGLAESAIRNRGMLRKRFRELAKRGDALHLVGLLSGSSLYANQQYVEVIAEYAHETGVRNIFIHAILDGVDAPSDAGLNLIQVFERRVRERAHAEIVSVCGRSWGMDHDGFWNRTEAVFRAMAYGESVHHAKTVEEAVRDAYEREMRDDRMEPVVIAPSETKHHRMNDGDAVLFWNIRPYGMRQLLKAFSLPTMQSFERGDLPDLTCMSLVEYDYDLPVDVVFPAEQSKSSLGLALSQLGLKQLRIAEAERFAHVTVFLNGMHEAALPGEDRIIIPSPAVSSYEHVPAMAMSEVSDETINAIAGGTYDVIVCNLCAPDIAASTGREDLTIEACEAMDRSIHRIVDGVLAVGGVLVIVGDSGHAEGLRDPLTNEPNRNSTANPVPCMIVGSAYEGLKASVGDVVGGDLSLSKPSGTLADIAPTILHILSLPIPKEMTGKSLI